MLNSQLRGIPVALGFLVPLTLAMTLALSAAQQRTRNPRPAAPPAAAVPPSPFHSGEILEFSGVWMSVSDAFGATIKVMGEAPFYGRQAWHLQAICKTNSYFHYIYPVDDQFDSYSGRTDFVGMQFEMYQHESTRSETHIYRLSATQTPAPAGATQVQVLPGTRDAIGFAYYLRTVNWNQTAEVRSPMFDGRRLYEVRARLATPRGDITVPAGKFSAAGIAVQLFDHGVEVSKIHFTWWLALDAAHTPVLLEMELPFGTGRLELTRKIPGS